MSLVRPTLSVKERDRRWGMARQILVDHKADCLLVAGLSGVWRFDIYLANEHADGLVLLPLDGDPVYLTWTPAYIARHMENRKRFGMNWIADWQLGTSGRGIVDTLKARGFANAKIAVVGLGGGETPIEPDGWIPYDTWAFVQRNLPNASFVNVTSPFTQLMLKKSDEELALMRYSAKVGELACQAMFDAVADRRNEGEVVAAITNVIYTHGCEPSPGPFLHSGVENLSWGYSIWMSQAQPPRGIKDGDIVQSEIFVNYGGIQSQQQMSIGVGRVDPVNLELADVARRSYEAGVTALRPGATFQQVAEAMEVPLHDADCWHMTPLVHSLSPNYLVGYIRVSMERMPGYQTSYQIKPIPPFGGQTILEPGMVIELEPNACKGKSRVNIGGAVIVTENGSEELNDLPTHVRFTQ